MQDYALKVISGVIYVKHKFTQKLQQRQLQNISLSYGMKQSIELLQMGTMQLRDYLEKELEENPMVEVEMNERLYLGSDENLDIEDKRESLQDELMKQLLYAKEKVNYKIAEYIVNLLDGNGYLHDSNEGIAQKMKCRVTDVEFTLAQIQCLYPKGVGARSLSECLLLQLDETNSDLCKNLIKNDLEDIARARYEKLCAKYNVDKKMLIDAILEIRNLDPKPASAYSTEKTVFVRPDLILKRNDNEIEILIPAYFNVRVNEYYREKNLEKEDRKFINEKIQQGKMIMECIHRRNQTLHNIMYTIVKKQEQYLLKTGEMNPLRMQDIAEELQCHETTVSRAMKDKYFEYENTIYPMKSLLNKGIQGKAVSEIKNKIKELIADEDKEKPLSDQKISDYLKVEGYQCSRRTVVKYREEMRIASAPHRKEMEIKG